MRDRPDDLPRTHEDGHRGGRAGDRQSTGPHYHIAADEVLWDYAPHDTNDISGAPWTEDEKVFVQNGPARSAYIYRKSVYRAYTDSTFTKRVAAPTSCPGNTMPCDDTLGLMGPVIRAVVGDTIKVVFRNNTSFPAPIHPHGLFYEKSSEGAPYADGTTGRTRLTTRSAPARRHTYIWAGSRSSRPRAMDGSSVMWTYHSHTDEIADTNAGLVGPMVITARERPTPTPPRPSTSTARSSPTSPSTNENASPLPGPQPRRLGPGTARGRSR